MISIIIIDYRNLEYTKRCLESLYSTSYKEKEIIIVCNEEDAESRRFYESELRTGRIKYHSFVSNAGLSIASNWGAKFAKGEYLFFLNNDTLVKPDIFERLLESKSDITGCRMLNYDGSRELDSAISVDRFGCPAGKTGSLFYPDGAIFIKKSIFDEIGGFDEKLFLYGEDRDLCWRGLLAGYSISVNLYATFYHNSTCVFPATNYFRRKLNERNIIRSILKNYSLKNLPWILLQYSFWSILEIGYILFTKPQAIWHSYLPAYWWNVVNFKNTMRARKKVIRRVKDKDLPFSKVIGKLWVLKNMGRPKWKKY